MNKVDKLKQILTENNFRGELASKNNAELFNLASEVLGGDQPEMIDGRWIGEVKVEAGSQLLPYLLYQIVLLSEKISKLEDKVL